MLKEFIRGKKFASLFLFLLICSSSVIGYFSLLFINNQSAPSANSQSLKDHTPSFQSLTNLTPSGPGKTYNFYENSWGSKSHKNLNRYSNITWETPGAWSGRVLSVSITDLKQVTTGAQDEVANILDLESGTYRSGGLADTYSTNGIFYNSSWTLQEFKLTLTFYDFSPYYALSNIDIFTYSYSTDEQGPKQRVSYYIYNFSRGDYDPNPLAEVPLDSIDWANSTINTGCSDYISSGTIRIQFRATVQLYTNYFLLDYIRVRIIYTSRYVRPFDVGLRLEGMFVQGSSYGYGTLTLTGTWNDDPKNFQFSANSDIIFNATSTFTITQTKLNTVNSTYYLNLSSPMPTKHQWKLQFYQDPFLNGNFTYFNFSISTIPVDWQRVNMTNPGGQIRILSNTSISGGFRFYANNNSIYSAGGTWRMYFKSPNYINNVELRTSGQLLPQNPKLLITDTLSIRSIFSRPITNGKVNLTISFEGKVHYNESLSGVSGSQRNFTNWVISSTANKNGTYLITASFFNATEIGIYTCPILVIFPTNLTLISPDLRSIEFLKGEPINLTVFFKNLFYPGNFYNERGINSSRVKWEISNVTYSETGDLTHGFQGQGYYNATIKTLLLKVVDGDYYLTVFANKTTYQNQTLKWQIRCFERLHTTNAAIMIQTALRNNIQWINGMNYTAWVYPNQSITLQLNYTDIYKSPQPVDYANVTAYLFSKGSTLLLDYPHIGIRFGVSFFKVNISTNGLSAGKYSLLINVSKKFYLNSSVWIDYTIRELYPTIKVSKLYESGNITTLYNEWERLTISFKTQYTTTKYSGFNSFPNSPVNWGKVRYYIVPINGDPLNPAHIIKSDEININATGFFVIRNLPLSNTSGSIPPGNYSVYIKANATDCLDRWFKFDLRVLKTLDTQLTITRFPSTFRTDQLITIEAKLDSAELQEKWWLNGKKVIFNITVFYNSREPFNFSITGTADQDGDVEILFKLTSYAPEPLDDVASMEISAYFNAFIVYYPAKSLESSSSTTIHININVPFDFMFIIYIILGVAVGATAAVIVHRKVIVPAGVQKTKSIDYLFTSFRDVVGLQNLFVLLKGTGDCILAKTYSPEGIEEAMQKALTNTIANFGKGDQRHDAFCDIIRFENFTIIVDDGDFIRAAATIGAKPSDKLIRSLVRFVQFFELQNYSLLKTAKGSVQNLQGVEELLDLQFGASLIAPYTIRTTKKLSGFDNTLRLMATDLMADHGYFYLRQLYSRATTETLIEEMMIFKTFQNLMDKQIIVPYVPSKKKERVVKKIAKPEQTDFERFKTDLISIKNKALKAFNDGKYEEATEFYHEAASLAAALGDIDAKEKLLQKAYECLAKVTPQEITKEKILPAEISPPEEISETIPEPEEIQTLPGPEELEIKPVKPPKLAPPTPLEAVMKKSKDLLDVSEPAPSISASSLTDETVPEEEGELTPFEKALAIRDKQLAKATDLMEEEAPLTIEEEALRIIDEIPPEPKPSPQELVPPPSIKELKKQLPEREIISLPPTPILKEIPPLEKPIPTIEQKPIIEAEIAPEEAELAPETLPEKMGPIPSLSDKETKVISKLIQESQKDFQTIINQITQTNDRYQEFSKQLVQTKGHVRNISASILDKTKSLLQHLLVPRKDIVEELKITENELPKLVKDIDTADVLVVNLKKDITISQKDCKKLIDELEEANKKIATIDKYLTKTAVDEMEREKQQFTTLTTNYTEAQGILNEVNTKLAKIHQEIVTLMIDDIEKIMAQQQKVEKTYNEINKRVKDSIKVQEAFTKENLKLNEELTSLERIISLIEIAFNEITVQKQILLSETKKYEKVVPEKVDEILLLIKETSKDISPAFAEIQGLKTNIEKNLQQMRLYREKIEKTLKEWNNADKLIASINKRKDNIDKVIEKTTKFIFPESIQKERALVTEFDEKFQEFVRKGQNFQLEFNSAIQSISQNLEPKLKDSIKTLQNIESTAMKAMEETKSEADQRFFQEISESLDTEKPEPVKITKKDEEKREGPLTDKDLGIKQHCPYCKAILTEKTLNLLRKGFEPECPECGQLIKLDAVHLD